MSEPADGGVYGTTEVAAALPENRFPWPPPADGSVVGALVDTWRGAVLHPTAFFRAMPPVARVGPALLYYLVVGIVARALDLFWQIVLPREEGSALIDALGPGAAASPLVDFLLSPLILLFSILLSAGVTHLLVLALAPANEGYGTTLRVFAFAYSPALFSIIPRVGAIPAFIWMVVLSVIGIREAHRTSTARASIAVLVPVLIGGMFLAFAFLLVRSGALLSAP